VNAEVSRAYSEQVKRRYHMGTFLKCVKIWNKNQNPTFIIKEKDGVLRGYCEDRKIE